MRLFALTALLLIAAPAAAQELGERTQSPEAMLAGIDRTSPDEEMERLAAAADAHPLGTVDNPIRVGGPEGEHAYLARLVCADGSPARIGARRDAGVGAFGSVVAAYDVTCGAAEHRIVFDMYHEEHVETRAPTGFTLAPQ